MHAVIKEPLPPFTEMRVQADGGTVAARTCGAGAPMVLFHSLLADDTSFDRIAPALARTHKLVILNLPGFGASDRVDGGLDAVADRVAAAIGG